MAIRLRDWKEVIHMDFPPINVNNAALKATIKAAESGRYSPADIRLSTDRFYTNEEYQRYRAAELRRPLP